jgi:hypothetical protein
VRSFLILVVVSAAPALSQTVYTWEDKDGIHYTDDINQVPKGQKKVEREQLAPTPAAAPKRAVAVGTPAAPSPASAPAPASVPEKLDEKAWRDRFINGHRRIQTLKQSIVALEQSLPPRLQCNAVPVVAAVPGAAGPAVAQPLCTVNPQHDVLVAEINQRRVALKDAELDLEQLERDSTREQVPREWRRGW